MTTLASIPVISNACAERDRTAAVFGQASAQRLVDEARVLEALRAIAAERGLVNFTCCIALSQTLGRLAVGVLRAGDTLVVIERGIAELADYAVAIEDERARGAAPATGQPAESDPPAPVDRDWTAREALSAIASRMRNDRDDPYLSAMVAMTDDKLADIQTILEKAGIGR